MRADDTDLCSQIRGFFTFGKIGQAALSLLPADSIHNH